MRKILQVTGKIFCFFCSSESEIYKHSLC